MTNTPLLSLVDRVKAIVLNGRRRDGMLWWSNIEQALTEVFADSRPVATTMIAALQPAAGGEGVVGRFCRIKEIIDELTETYTSFGNTCVYIRPGGFSWGAVALNRRDDDKAGKSLAPQPAMRDEGEAVHIGKWVTVPSEPTAAMRDAGGYADDTDVPCDTNAHHIWDAMVRAAPAHPSSHEAEIIDEGGPLLVWKNGEKPPIGTKLFTYPPDALKRIASLEAESAGKNARIKELEYICEPITNARVDAEALGRKISDWVSYAKGLERDAEGAIAGENQRLRDRVTELRQQLAAASERLENLLDAFTNPETGEYAKRLAIKDARAALTKKEQSR